ncbi:hypothetical protein [uncultured Desulfosarcina sp.]|uniref:hypothetical protein n=1 Tax=uncultured Desulfosarcina sp. TaxID=218289 RepID=UPI0029C7253D|nr:hypothetical protein [uncultured Desulfosarcina sp.]
MIEISNVQAILDIAQGKDRPDLSPAFYAEPPYLFLGLQGRGPGKALADLYLIPGRFKHREAAIERSGQLDDIGSVYPETVFLPDICVMLKILSSEYQLYACGKIYRMP